MKMTISVSLVLVGVTLMVVAPLLANAGSVPSSGLLAAALSPDLFLGGQAPASFGVASLLTPSRANAAMVAADLCVGAGLNTRLPVLLSDLVAGEGGKPRVVSTLNGVVGQPMHVVSSLPEISARQDQFAHVMPACYGDGCWVTKGFRTPNPEILHDYWRENVVEVVLAAGFSLARPAEAAPSIAVEQSDSGRVTRVRFALKDENGKLLASSDGRYRNGFPAEMEDGAQSREYSPRLALEYLLHGNLLNTLAGHLARPARSYPLKEFLRAATNLTHPQGSALGFWSGATPVGQSPPSIQVELDILETRPMSPSS